MKGIFSLLPQETVSLLDAVDAVNSYVASDDYAKAVHPPHDLQRLIDFREHLNMLINNPQVLRSFLEESNAFPSTQKELQNEHFKRRSRRDS